MPLTSFRYFNRRRVRSLECVSYGIVSVHLLQDNLNFLLFQIFFNFFKMAAKTELNLCMVDLYKYKQRFQSINSHQTLVFLLLHLPLLSTFFPFCFLNLLRITISKANALLETPIKTKHKPLFSSFSGSVSSFSSRRCYSSSLSRVPFVFWEKSL